MQEASDDLEFEKAIEYRELLHSVKQIAQKQKITDTGGEEPGYCGSCKESMRMRWYRYSLSAMVV